jgi:hypothetical protein
LFKNGTDASLSVRRQFVAGIADAFEGSVHVDAFAVVAHSRLSTLVHVDAKRSNGRAGKSFLANALERAGDILTAAVQTNARIFGAFVQI